MPAKNRPLPQTLDGRGDEGLSAQQNFPRRQRQRRPRRVHAAVQPLEDAVDNDDEDSEGIDPKDLPEYIRVNLDAIRKDVECPICLGIIKNTRTVMACLHRFCAKCIEKSMRMGDNNECPICRVHCSSRRALREDLVFDNLISIIFPDIEKYEEEEYSLLEEEKARNNQIQDSFAQIYKRQCEALKKRVRTRKDRADETSKPEIPQNSRRVSKRRGRPVRRIEQLSWGGAGTRSHGPHSHACDSNGTGITRLNTLVNHLQSLQVNDKKLEVNLMLISLDNHTSSSQKLYLCCDPRLSVKNLCKYIAKETSLEAKNVEVMLIKKSANGDLVSKPSTNEQSASMGDTSKPSTNDKSSATSIQVEDGLLNLRGGETLADLQANGSTVNGNLVLAYWRKDTAKWL